MAFLVRERYDEGYFAGHVRRYLRRGRFVRNLLANVFDLLGDPAGRRILDVGCGVGTFAIEVARRGGSAVAVDAARPGLAAGRELAARLGVTGVRFLAADAARLPLAAGSVDGAVCADLTEHLDDETLAALLAEVARVLRPDGVLALYTPSPTHLFERLKDRGWLLEQDPGHIGLRTADVLAAAVRRAGLAVEVLQYRPTHLPVYRRIERMLARLPGAAGGLFRRRVCIAARKPAPVRSRPSRAREEAGGGGAAMPWESGSS